MTTISIYDADGRISRIIRCPQSMVQVQIQEGDANYVEGSYDGQIYRVIGGLPFPRPTMTCTLDKAQIAADGIDIATLSGLPDPCTVIYEGPGFRLEGEVTGGTAEFTTDAPGAHRVTVTAWPHLDWEGGFDAV